VENEAKRTPKKTVRLIAQAQDAEAVTFASEEATHVVFWVLPVTRLVDGDVQHCGLLSMI